MSSSLKKQAVHGAFWSFTERFGQHGIQLVISIILARLLEPKDFGIVAMIMIFTMLARTVVDSGFGIALIQKQDATHTDESTAFWFNIFVGVLMAAGLSIAASWIAAFYDAPILTPILWVFSFNLFISSLGVVQNALLTKELLFKQRMGAVLAGTLVSGVVGVGMALKGCGVWSLVASSVVANGVTTMGLWVVHPWRPAWTFSIASFRVLFKFGSKMLLSGILTTVFRNIYLVVIGKLYSATDLGFYQTAKRLIVMTSQSLSLVVSQVNLPLLARVQNDRERMRHAFSKVLQTTVLVIMPLVMGLAVSAPSLIRVLLGEKWMPCVPYLQLSCINAVFFPFHLLNLNVITAIGRSDIHLKLELIKKVLIVFFILVTYRYGIMAMLWGQVVCSSLSLLLNTFYVHRFLQYGLVRQFCSIRKIFAASVLMMIVAWGVGRGVDWPAFGILSLQIAAGGVVFMLVEWLLKDPVFIEVMAIVVERFSRKKSVIEGEA